MEQRNFCSQETMDFLLFSYFGITLEDGVQDEVLLNAAIRRAYRDAASHVLHLTEKQKEDNPKEAAISVIMKAIAQLSEKQDFDTWHSDLCEELIDRYPSDVMSYGIAQKWVNMTMKYLCILHELFPESDYGKAASELKSMLHVPIDSYILEAAKKDEDLRLPKLVDSWSNLKDPAAYLEYQKTIRSRKNHRQMDWEGKAWIAIAKKRRK